MRGGAYGCSSSLNHLDGRFLLTSYRDPHIDQTLDLYRAAGGWLSALQLDDRALEQAKIGTLGKMDPPERPATMVSKSFFRHLVGLTYERRLSYWEQILETRLDHIHHFGHVLTKAMETETRVCTLSGPTGLDASRVPFRRTRL
jgi:Zn-dependent M16 (insulinase) family peptidase